MTTVPLSKELEAVTITPYEVTAGNSQVVDPYAIDITLLVPAGTVAVVETESTAFGVAQSLSINSNNRPMSNSWTISISAGPGPITVLVSRVSGRPATNA